MVHFRQLNFSISKATLHFPHPQICASFWPLSWLTASLFTQGPRLTTWEKADGWGGSRRELVGMNGDQSLSLQLLPSLDFHSLQKTEGLSTFPRFPVTASWSCSQSTRSSLFLTLCLVASFMISEHRSDDQSACVQAQMAPFPSHGPQARDLGNGNPVGQAVRQNPLLWSRNDRHSYLWGLWGLNNRLQPLVWSTAVRRRSKFSFIDFSGSWVAMGFVTMGRETARSFRR